MLKPERKLLTGLTALFSLAILFFCGGCADKVKRADPPPAVIKISLCPKPAVPGLPLLTETKPLDSPANVKILLERDDLFRQYIDGLKSAIVCYEKQRN